MKDTRDLVLVRECDGGHEFILIDTSKGTTPMRSGGSTYNDVIGFPLKRHGDQDISYPVVYDDNTVGIMREEATVTSHGAMPSSVIRRYERWSRSQ